MGVSTRPVFSALQKRRVQGLGGMGHLFSLFCTVTVTNALFLLYLFITLFFSVFFRENRSFRRKNIFLPCLCRDVILEADLNPGYFGERSQIDVFAMCQTLWRQRYHDHILGRIFRTLQLAITTFANPIYHPSPNTDTCIC